LNELYELQEYCSIVGAFLRARASIAIAHISYGNSVRLSVHPSWPSTNSSPSEIESLGFHHMIA